VWGLGPPQFEHGNGADSGSLACVLGKAWVAPRLLGVDAVAFSAGQSAGGRRRAPPGRLVLDLSGLVFVDVAGARALDATHMLLQAACPVIVGRPRPSARKVLGITGLMET
jgi:hypothetical protein